MLASQRDRLRLILELVQHRLYKPLEQAAADIEAQCDGIGTGTVDNFLDGMEALAREVAKQLPAKGR